MLDHKSDCCATMKSSSDLTTTDNDLKVHLLLLVVLDPCSKQVLMDLKNKIPNPTIFQSIQTIDLFCNQIRYQTNDNIHKYHPNSNNQYQVLQYSLTVNMIVINTLPSVIPTLSTYSTINNVNTLTSTLYYLFYT